MARPVIELLRARRPDAQFAYTFFSPSAATFAQRLPVDVADYLPFDTPTSASAMLDALAPSAIVFCKLDVWPLLVAEAARRRVPLALTSAAVRTGSGRSSGLARLLIEDAYAALDAVGAVHADDAAGLVAIGARRERIVITGDTRYDQVWRRVTEAREDLPAVARLRTDRPTLVAGSTWPSDEATLLPAWLGIRKQIPAARLILAAHEPSAHHTAAVLNWAAGAGLSGAVVASATSATDVVIVDGTGLLADLYALATVSFVGGGFHAAGLHSVVEPAAYGSPVVFGPRGANTRDADALISAGGGYAAADAQAIAARVGALLDDAALRSRASRSARGVIENGLGAAERSAELVARLLPR